MQYEGKPAVAEKACRGLMDMSMMRDHLLSNANGAGVHKLTVNDEARMQCGRWTR